MVISLLDIEIHFSVVNSTERGKIEWAGLSVNLSDVHNQSFLFFSFLFSSLLFSSLLLSSILFYSSLLYSIPFHSIHTISPLFSDSILFYSILFNPQSSVFYATLYSSSFYSIPIHKGQLFCMPALRVSKVLIRGSSGPLLDIDAIVYLYVSQTFPDQMHR